MLDLSPLSPLDSIKSLITSLVLPTCRSAATRRAYNIALRDFIGFMVVQSKPFTRQTVMEFIAEKRERKISASGINQALSAIKKLAYEARYAPSGVLHEAEYRGIEDIRSEKKEGRRTGNWLTIEQVTQLLHSIPMDLAGKRDRALLAVLVGCALRRDEVLKLKPSQIVQREGRWVFADVLGKGNKYRTVPIPAGVKARIDDWLNAQERLDFGPDFKLFCPIKRGGRIPQESVALSDSAIAYIVRVRAEGAGLGKIAPHDLRRTFAKAVRKAGADLDQIKVVLGHASTATTEGYVGENQSITKSPCDLLDTDWGAITPIPTK